MIVQDTDNSTAHLIQPCASRIIEQYNQVPVVNKTRNAGVKAVDSSAVGNYTNAVSASSERYLPCLNFVSVVFEIAHSILARPNPFL